MADALYMPFVVRWAANESSPPLRHFRTCPVPKSASLKRKSDGLPSGSETTKMFWGRISW